MEFPTNALLLALSLVGVGSLAYLLFSRDEEEITTVPPTESFETLVRVPKNCVGVVIGRQGANINQISATTGCKIKFKDSKEDAEYTVCSIRGAEDNVRTAEASIHAVIANQPLIETFEMTVPNNACGRIIGKNGENIRNISSRSNAKITISRSGLERQVVIIGTSEQIALARSLIEEKVAEEKEFESRVEQSVSRRSPRHTPKYLLQAPADNSTNSAPAREKLIPTGSDGLLEVYASAVESPDRIWLQVRGPSTVELDRLNEIMTEYYSKPENMEIHALTEARVGQLVAAPFMYDNKYYRAQICEIHTTETGHELDLYYVDYGDSALCLQTHSFQLRTKYLKLRFQAIECIIARIKPSDEEWSESAIDALEELSHVALWKPLTAKIHSYRDRPTKGKRDGSPVPCVDLYDTTGPEEVDIALQLVNRGFAVWAKDDSGFTDNAVEKADGNASNNSTSQE